MAAKADSGGRTELEQQIQNRVTQLELLNAQAKQLQAQQAELLRHMSEIEKAQAALEDLTKQKRGTETLIPLGAGVFVHAKVEDATNVITSVGAGIAIKRSIEEALKFVEEQAKGVQMLGAQTGAQLQQLENLSNMLSQELRQLVQRR